MLRGNINRLSERVRQVLRGEVGLGTSFQAEFELLNLRPQVDDIIRDLGPLAISAGTEVKNEIPHEVQVHSDAQLLSQIMQNLLSNALKFTSQGTVEIGARYVDAEGSVECWVKDSGEGIAPIRLTRCLRGLRPVPNRKKWLGLDWLSSRRLLSCTRERFAFRVRLEREPRLLCSSCSPTKLAQRSIIYLSTSADGIESCAGRPGSLASFFSNRSIISCSLSKSTGLLRNAVQPA